MFLVCGEALWDLFASESPDGVTFDARIGGSPLNVALGLARLGQDSALFTGLSRDRLGERIDRILRREGVRRDFLVRLSAPTTLSLVDLGEDGAPAYAFYGEGAADRSLRPGHLPDLPDGVWGVHAGSYSLVAEPVGSTLLALMRREAGQRLLAIDPNVRLNVEPDVGRWRERIDAFAGSVDLIKTSEEDLGILHPDLSGDRVAARWRRAGARLVIITRGASGAEAFGAFGRVSRPARPVEVVDTVGAGDSFQAALIAGLARLGATSAGALGRLGPAEVAALLDDANAAAAITCTRRGADHPRRADIEAFD